MTSKASILRAKERARRQLKRRHASERPHKIIQKTYSSLTEQQKNLLKERIGCVGKDLFTLSVKNNAENHESDDSDEHEDLHDYYVGGYHEVKVGEFYNDRYIVLHKLGWGYFSTVWLSMDLKNGQLVALKIVKSDKSYTELAMDEIQILKTIRSEGIKNEIGRTRIVNLYDDFIIEGPNGKHVVLVFEVLGKNLLKLVKEYNYEGLPLSMVKNIAKQLLLGLDHLHQNCRLIHTDIKPENVLLTCDHKSILRLCRQALTTILSEHAEERSERSERPLLHEINTKESSVNETPSVASSVVSLEEELKSKENFTNDCTFTVKLADLGNACWTYKHFTNDIQTRQYRSPEVILEAGYDTITDMWSLACMLFELATGDYLFQPKRGRHYSRDEDHLAMIVELIGPIPKSLYDKGKLSKKFLDSKGKPRHIKDLKPWDLYSVLLEKYDFNPEEAEIFSSFLLPMLSIDPETRSTAAESLKHPFLRDT
ncbi:SRSF protein kinase 1-like isoform X2 [Zophobas morio]|jgi:serine/threonine-protein kinase SRPK3|uniref:SRSF protein kinase 1-like isoform X2 n=1 Tax=Zophobas morio TaxID=2755281 RepID=UPI003082BF6F